MFTRGHSCRQEMEYKYLGDRYTAPECRNRACRAVRRENGKCIRGRNGNMLVEWADNSRAVVVARLLRKIR